MTVYNILKPSKKYTTKINLNSPQKRKAKSPCSKTQKPLKKDSQFRRHKSKTMTEKEEYKINKIEKTLKKAGIQDVLEKLKKSQSKEYTGDPISLPSSSRENNDKDYREEDQDFADDREMEYFKYHRFFLTIKKPCKNLPEFKNERLLTFLKESRIFYGILLFFYTFHNVVDFLIHSKDFSESKTFFTLAKCFINISLFFLSFFGIEKLFSFFLMRLLLIVFILILFLLQIIDLVEETDIIMRDIMFSILFCPLIFLTNFAFFSFVEILFINFSFMAALLVVIIYSNIPNLENISMTILILCHNMIKIFFQLRFHIKSFNNLKSSHIKQAEQEEKISQLLPIHVKYFFSSFFKFYFLKFLKKSKNIK